MQGVRPLSPRRHPSGRQRAGKAYAASANAALPAPLALVASDHQAALQNGPGFCQEAPGQGRLPHAPEGRP